jgi:trimeric autotransporter adhesin
MVFVIPSIHHKNIHKTGRKSYMAYQPKSYRKFVATTATAAMVASAVAPVVSAASFTDVAPQYKDAVDFLVSTGATNGKTETKFGVYDEITRLDAAVILARVLKLDVDNAKDAGFTDVPKDRAKYVNALVEAGVLNGKTETRFGAYDKLTRVEMAKIIANAYNLKGDDVELPFTDVNDTWAPYVKALYKNGVTKGKTETKFGAYENITRGDFARFVYNAHNATVVPEVTAVSAINLNQIKITFNKELDALSASDIANFDVKDKVAGTSVLDTDGLNNDDSKVTLQADKKSVIIDLNTGATPTELTVGKTYEIVVNKNLKFADGKTLGTTYNETIVADDKVAPTVQEVKATATGFQIKFNEPIDLTNKGVVKVNGVNLPATAITPGSDKFTVNVAYTPEAGKTYSITTVAFEDLNGNQSETETNSVTYSADNTAPVLQSVTAQDEKTIKLVFSEEIAPGTTATVSRDTTVFANAVALRQDTNEKNVYYVDLNNNLSSLYPAGATSTTVKVDLSTFKDAANNVAPATSRSVTLNKDVTAPTVVSEDWDGTNYVLKFSEKLKASSLTTSGIIVTDETGALVSSGVTFEVHDDKAGTGGAAGQEDGEYLLVKGLAPNKTYTISFPAGVVTDTSIAGNANAAFTKTVTTKAVSNDTTAPTLSSITPSTSNGKNVITLVFDETLDASARDLANFKLDGAALPSGTVAYLDTTTNTNDTIVITLPESAVSYDGQYTFTYMNIKDKNGNTAKSATKVVTLKDTVKPVLTSAKITGSNTIELTFSEAINDTTLATLANVVDDFAITVNGVDINEATDVTGVSTGSTANDSKIVLTITGYNLTGQTVTVTTTTTADTVTDNSSLGNTLKTGVTVTATN